jgi:hypothetical protein
MGRSSKSDLSPSISKPSGIDLGKNDAGGIDMGRKSSPSVSSNGIGISQEVGNIGGVTVTGGVSVDITPIDLGINYDPSENSLGIAAGAEFPGGLLGASGGVTVDLGTGQITGIQAGGEALGLGVGISASKDGGIGIEFTVQIPFTPIEISLGFGLPPKSPKKEKPPTSTLPNKENKGFGSNKAKWPLLNPNCYYNMIILLLSEEEVCENCLGYGSGDGSFGYSFEKYYKNGKYSHIMTGVTYNTTTKNYEAVVKSKDILGSVFSRQRSWLYVVEGDLLKQSLSPNGGSGVSLGKTIINTGGYVSTSVGSPGSADWEKIFQQMLDSYNNGRRDYTNYLFIPLEFCPNAVDYTPILNNESFPNPAPPPESKPFPAPPPTKRNKMDQCCRDSIKLQRLIVRHLGATQSSGQETLPDGVREIGSTQEGIRQAYPFVVRKKWVDPNAKDNEGIPIGNDRQLALVLGGMIERLERVIGTSEFYKDSDKKLRQSEGNMLSWLTGKNKDFRYPDPNDFWLNTDDGVINEKTLEVRSIADGLRYQIEALNRLERILPIAELKDSSIPARWIYPKGEGQLRVGNLIHLCEYMIRKSDKDMGYWPQKITIKAANPAIKDDESITTDIHSQADMLRVILQQILDIEGDGDMGSNYDLRRTYLDIMAFQMTAKSTKYLEAITEYLGFDIIEEVSKIPIPFDPFAGQKRLVIEEWWIKYGFGQAKTNFPSKNTESEIEELSGKVLQNSELEVNTIKFGSLGAKKDPKTLKETLIEILKHSSASAAAVTEVATESALDRVVDAAGIAQKLASFLMRRDMRESLGIGDLDNWISSAEKGYTDNLESESLKFPESNSFEPYGRPTTENPTIREIDTKNPKAD